MRTAYGAGIGAPPLPPEQAHWFPPPSTIKPLRDAPWLIPPPDAINFNADETASVVGPGTAILAVRNTPPQFGGVVRELSYSINDVLLTTNVTFAFRFNQAPQDGFRRTIFPKVVATDVIAFDPPTTVIKIPLGASMDVLVTVADAQTYSVNVFYRGWWYDGILNEQWGGYHG